VAVVMEIHRFLNCSRILERHLHLGLVRQTTQFFIQTLELLRVLVLQQLVTKQQFFTHHLELHLQVELFQ
jgi:hypothetical protein